MKNKVKFLRIVTFLKANIYNMIIFKKYYSFIIAAIISFVSAIFEINTKIGKVFTAYFSSFVLGILINTIFEIYDKTYIESFLKQILSYTLCISLILTFSWIKKKNTITFKSSKNKENIFFYEEKQDFSIINLLIHRRLLHFGVAFLFGATGTIIGGILSYYLIKVIFIRNNDKTDSYLKKSAVCFISTYIGGYINFIEVADLLNITSTVKSSIFILDDIFTSIFLTILPLFRSCKFLFYCGDNILDDTDENLKKNNSLELNDEEETHLTPGNKIPISYGSFTNDNEIYQKDVNSQYCFAYNNFIKCLYDSLSILFIILLSKKILNDYELVYQFIVLYIKIDKLKTFILLAIALAYVCALDYIVYILNNTMYHYKISKFITKVYFRSLEYHSTVLKFLTIYYLSLSGILINVKNLYTIAKPLIMLIICMLMIHLLCTFMFSYVYNAITKSSGASLDKDEVLLAINANIGGPTTAALMSEILRRPDLTFAATFWGVVGYLIATNISMSIYSFL